MNSRDPRPSSGWSWFPRREHRGPLDGKYVQHAWVRLYRPGPGRLVATGGCALVTMLVAALSITLATQSRGLVMLAVVGAISILAIGSTAAFTVRVLSSSVYVTDFGVRVLTLRSERVLAWTDVADVRRVGVRSRPWGLLPTRDAERVVMVVRGGDDVDAHINSVDGDFLGRPEAYDIAALALERWWRDGRRHAETDRSR